MIEKMSWLSAEPELVLAYTSLLVALIAVLVITTIRAAVITSGRPGASTGKQVGSWAAAVTIVGMGIAFVWALVFVVGGILG